MLKNISRLECKIGEKIYHLSCDFDSPLTEVKEAIFQFSKYIGHIEDQIKAQEEAKKVQEDVQSNVEPIPEINEETKVEQVE